jgi:hypothetical protein
MVELVTVSYKAPKELNDFRVALVALIEDLMAKKSISQIALENVQNFWTAIQGIDKLPQELKSELHASLETIGHLGGCIAGCLLTPHKSV